MKSLMLFIFDSPISKLISLNQITEIRKNCFVVVALDDNALFFRIGLDILFKQWI